MTVIHSSKKESLHEEYCESHEEKQEDAPFGACADPSTGSVCRLWCEQQAWMYSIRVRLLALWQHAPLAEKDKGSGRVPFHI